MPQGMDAEERRPTPARVLLVEDNAMVAMSAEEQLLEIGVEQVFLARSVAEAEAHCDSHQFDFALLDFDLGNETSINVAARLKWAEIPFAFASGFGEFLDLPSDLHGSAILKKPYLIADLERALLQSRPA
jgi:CheY-like chemotaxis protein